MPARRCRSRTPWPTEGSGRARRSGRRCRCRPHRPLARIAGVPGVLSGLCPRPRRSSKPYRGSSPQTVRGRRRRQAGFRRPTTLLPLSRRAPRGFLASVLGRMVGRLNLLFRLRLGLPSLRASILTTVTALTSRVRKVLNSWRVDWNSVLKSLVANSPKRPRRGSAARGARRTGAVRGFSGGAGAGR